MGGLAALRSDVDGHAAPASLNEMPFAAEVQGRYDALADVLLDDLAAAADAAPRDLRVGAQLYAEGLRQIALVPRMRFAMVQGATGSTGDGTWVADTSALAGTMARGRAVVARLASGTPYEEVASRLQTELDAAGVSEIVVDAMGTGEYDLPTVLQALRLDPGQGWMAFVDRVEEMLLA